MPSAYLQWRFHSGEPVVARGHLVSNLYVTFILQWIAVIFGRDKEDNRCFTCNSYFLHYLKIPTVMPLGVFLVFRMYNTGENVKMYSFKPRSIIKADQTTGSSWHLKCVFLSHYSLETPKRVTDKQCKPRSDAAECLGRYL